MYFVLSISCCGVHIDILSVNNAVSIMICPYLQPFQITNITWIDRLGKYYVFQQQLRRCFICI